MANYTMTIAEMVNNGLTQNIFPTTYDFYVDDAQARKAFEDKFIKHYYYREIGFESPFMFIQKLESHLLLNMPYWKQLYQTELETRGINFLLNKDLKESTTRELSGIESGVGNKTLTNEERQSLSSTSTNNGESSSIINGESSSTTSGESSSTTSGESSSTTSGESSSTTTDKISSSTQSSVNNKTSQLSDGVSNASLEQGYLTGVKNEEQTNTGTQDSQTTSNNTQEFTSTNSQESTTNNTQESTTNNTQESTTNNTQESTTTNSQQSSGQGTQSQEETNRRESTHKETITLLSQGNIGITSSAKLLKEWREVLINMDKIIIESCNDLFMKIY